MTQEDLTMFMNIRTDYGFKYIFGKPKNKHLLIRFLNALFGDRITITDVEYHDKEVLPKNKDGKRIVYDIYCKSNVPDYTNPLEKHYPSFYESEKKKEDGKEHHFILEMQNEYEPPFEDRVIYYGSKQIAEQGKAGWNYNLAPVVTVVVANFDFKHMGRKLKREISLVDTESGELFSDKMKIIVLSLRQMANIEWDECKTELQHILYLINNMETFDTNSKPYLSKLYEDFFDAAQTATLAAEETVAYSQSLERFNSYLSGVEHSYAEGRAEGRAEGLTEGLLQAYQRCVDSGMSKERAASIIGIDPSQIR